MKLTPTRRVWLTAAALAVAAGLAAIYYCLDPSSGLFPQCLFRRLTGLECPGCGSQRALHALLHGRVADAAAFNPLLIAELPLILLLGAAPLLSPRLPRLYSVLASRTFILSLLAVILLWTVVRNIHSITSL